MRAVQPSHRLLCCLTASPASFEQPDMYMLLSVIRSNKGVHAPYTLAFLFRYSLRPIKAQVLIDTCSLHVDQVKRGSLAILPSQADKFSSSQVVRGSARQPSIQEYWENSTIPSHIHHLNQQSKLFVPPFVFCFFTAFRKWTLWMPRIRISIYISSPDTIRYERRI